MAVQPSSILLLVKNRAESLYVISAVIEPNKIFQFWKCAKCLLRREPLSELSVLIR